MTCSKNFGRLLQVSCLGLIGMLTAVGCGGSENPGTGKDASTEAGTGGTAGASLNLDKSTVNLGPLDLKQTGVGTVTVTNIGKAASGTLTVTGVGVTATGCTGTIAAGANCTLTITATPTAAGPFTGSVTIAANPGASPTPLTVSVIAQVSNAGVFTVSPASIDLGNVAVGVAAPKQTITVTAAVAITDLLVIPSGADVTIDKTASTCVAALAANTPCLVVVNFLATTAGNKSDSIGISGGGLVKNVPVTAVAQKPAALVISPTASQTFVAAVGSSSSPITFGVVNSGDVASGSIAVALTGANATDFSQTNNCLILAPLGTCTVSVVFKASVVGTVPAVLTLTDQGPGATTVSVPLSGVGSTASTLTITPASGDLGSALVNATGPATIFTVTNGGDAASGALVVSLSSSDFVIVNDTCAGASIAKAGTCTISVSLKPSSVGAKSATLSVTGTNGLPAVKGLTGVGLTGGSLAATPAALDFGSVRLNKTGTAQTVTVKNTGGSNTLALSFTKGGDFAMFPITANTCSAALGPLATCTFTVNFTPTSLAKASWTATYTITDGVSSAVVAVSGNALEPAGIDVAPSSTQDFGSLVIGGVSAPIGFTVTAASLPAGITDTGAVTVALAGTNAAAFTIVTNGCTAALLLTAQCQFGVTFNPAAAGALQATLSVTTVNGGSFTVLLKGTGLAILEIVPVTESLPTGATGLDFGQLPVLVDPSLIKPANINSYTVTVRGPNSPTAHTSSVLTTLTDPSQPADFSYNDHVSTSPLLTNRCNTSSNQAVLLDFSTGAAPSPWTWTAGTKTFTCTFTVIFYPQSTKGNKTATLAAAGSGGTSDSKILTGVATGPILFDPSASDFGDTFQVGDSTNAQATLSGITLSGPDKTVTLLNDSSTQDFGPVSLTLAGTDADQFVIVTDRCSTTTLGHTVSTNFCYVTVAFAPTSIGAKTATLTATAGGETATATFTGGASAGSDITITPDQLDPTLAIPNVHDFGTVPQTGATAAGWTAFTIKNPDGSPRSAQVTFGMDDGTTAFILADGSNTTDATHHPYGTCGGSGTTTLAPGQSCTFFVQFNPGSDLEVDSVLTRTLLATDVAKGVTVKVLAQGKVGSILTIAPASLDFGDWPEAATSTNQTLTLSNKGSVAITLSIPGVNGITPFNVVQQSGTCTALATLAAGASCPLLVNFVGVAGTPDVVSKRTLEVTATPAGAATADLSGKTVRPAKIVAVGFDNTVSAFSDHINLGGVRNDGSTSANVTITFQNVGSVATSSLHYQWGSQPTVDTGDTEFLIVNEATGGCVGKTTLAPNDTCTVTVHFTPSSAKAAGARSNTFGLSATAGGLVQLFTFDAYALNAASGWMGIAGGQNSFFTFPTTPSGLAAASQPKQVFTITNNTGAAQTLALALANGTGSDTNSNFSLVVAADDAIYPNSAGSTPCVTAGASLANSASCTIGVVFHPTAWGVNNVYRWATISAGANFTGTSLGVIGRVQSPAALTITPQPVLPATALDLKQVLIGTNVVTAFTVTNGGETASTALTLSMGTGTNYSITNGTCTGVLAAGATCTGSVTFTAGTTPSTTVALADTLTVNGTATLSFTAFAVAQTLLGMQTAGGALMSTMTFTPAQAVGTTSATQTVYVHNSANAKTSGLFTLTLVDKVNFSIVDDPSSATRCLLASDTDAATETGLVGGATCTVVIKFNPKTLPTTGTFQTTLTVSDGSAATPPVLTITGTVISALTANPAGPTGPIGPITSPTPITFTLTAGAPTTAYLKTGISGANFMIVRDDCVNTKLGDTVNSCMIWVAFTGASPTPLQTGTLSVSGGATVSVGNSASVVLDSTTPPAP